MDLLSYLRIFRSHWLGIVAAMVLGAGLATGWAILQPKVYTAEVSGYVKVSSSTGDAGSALVADNLARAKVKSYIDIGSWRAVAERAIAELGLDTTPEALVGRVTVTNPLDTVNVNVSAQAPGPEEARDLAQAWLSSMAIEVGDLERGTQADGAVSLVEGDSARLPSEPSFPNVKLLAALGGVAGLVLGVVYAVARHTLDRRIRTAEGLEKETGLAAVGVLPLEKSFSGGSRLLPGVGEHVPHRLFSMSEAMRELRTNIQFMDVDNPPRILVMTSPLPGDGKSTTSANLAVTLAASGETVYIVDADLRRPMLAEIFGVPGDAGLTDILAQRATVDDVAQTVISSNLKLVAAGRIPPNPSELLGSVRMRSLLTQLAEDAIVIVDAPPLLPVTDAAVLSTQADGAVVVVSAGKTTYELLRRALLALDKVGGRNLGVVLNRVSKNGGSYYGGRYSRDYYAANTPTEAVGGEWPPAEAPRPVSSPDAGQLRRRGRRAG